MDLQKTYTSIDIHIYKRSFFIISSGSLSWYFLHLHHSKLGKTTRVWFVCTQMLPFDRIIDLVFDRVHINISGISADHSNRRTRRSTIMIIWNKLCYCKHNHFFMSSFLNPLHMCVMSDFFQPSMKKYHKQFYEDIANWIENVKNLNLPIATILQTDGYIINCNFLFVGWN